MGKNQGRRKKKGKNERPQEEQRRDENMYENDGAKWRKETEESGDRHRGERIRKRDDEGKSRK
ncbi:unnamed protein product [Ixodes persulcatus]